MRHLDLFSGIGGFALAVRWAGGKTVGFVEQDEWCRRVLEKNFPGVPQKGDIHNVRGDEFGPVDLVTGGFPCQPFSIAGQRRGAEDDRALWPQMRRVIDEAQPRWVLGENVTGIISMELDTVLTDLEADGYAAWAVVVPAVAVDAPHRRDRVWIMAHRDDGQRHGQNEEVRTGRDAALGRGQSLADADRQWQQQPERRGTKERGWTGDGCRWSSEPGMGRVAHGVPGRVDRLKGLGNAIVPQVAYEILRVMFQEDAV